MEKWKRKLPLPRTKFHSETSMSFFTDPNEHELSLTVTFSHGLKCLHNYHKLWHCLLHLITTPPPLPRDFLADSEKHELFLTVRLSRGQNPTNLEKVENYYKLWLFLWYLITFATPPPLHEIFSPALTSMNSPWQWDFLMTKIFPQVP